MQRFSCFCSPNPSVLPGRRRQRWGAPVAAAWGRARGDEGKQGGAEPGPTAWLWPRRDPRDHPAALRRMKPPVPCSPTANTSGHGQRLFHLGVFPQLSERPAVLGLPRRAAAPSRPVPPAPLAEPQRCRGGRAVTSTICLGHVPFRGRLSPAKQSDTARKVIFFPSSVCFCALCAPRQNSPGNATLKNERKRKKARKRAGAEGRALSISAQLWPPAE